MKPTLPSWNGAPPILALAALILSGSTALAQSRPDAHAPIGVMGDHTHDKGEWMLSYRYMYMNMTGNRVGTDSVSARLPVMFMYM